MAKRLRDRVRDALQPKVRATFHATCELFATFDQHCPLCGAFVPKLTRHKCGITNAPPRKP